MSKFSVPILFFVLVFSLFTGLYLSEDVRDQGPAASAGKFQSSQSVLTKPDVKILKASLNKREPVIITLGGLPFSKGGKSASLSDLDNFTTTTGDLIREHYLYPNGSVIGFGYDVDGYLRVSLWNGPPPPMEVSSIETLYAMLDERAMDMGIENIPVKFTAFTSPPVLVLGPSL
ncbi:MAG: hypothetical protein U9N40_00215 [Euryarchaeota archaeon]|nr:hypothetical protein [Euryarchaeota archaeon]